MANFRRFQRLEAAQMQRLEASMGHPSPYSFDAAHAKENIAKNRYRDILPFDSTRVKISNGPEYINASLVDNGYRRFIAAQGPLKDTCADFWEMVMEQSATVVMLCSVEEAWRPKCAQYWPLQAEEQLLVKDKMRHQEHLIACESSRTDADSQATIRTLVLNIKHQNNVHARIKKIKHIHFESWPDHDVTSIETITALLNLCINTHNQSETPNEPIIVHCSAGCGRTGTLIALHALQQDPTQDVVALVDRLRKQRIASVQAPSQFDLLCAFQASLNSQAAV